MAFVVFEGLDGSGKSTLIKKLAEHLGSLKISVELTREPGGTPLAEEIRHLLLRTTGEAPSPLTELLLYEAARAQHVSQKIRPAMAAGAWVLCDRFTGSTLAFQCGGRGLDRARVQTLNDIATEGLEPDLWVLLDLSLEESLRRRQRRDDSGEKALDRFELEQQQFHQKVRQYYLQLAKEQPYKWLVLNAEVAPEKVFEELLLRLQTGGWLK